jgi:hypothetical protein
MGLNPTCGTVSGYNCGWAIRHDYSQAGILQTLSKSVQITFLYWHHRAGPRRPSYCLHGWGKPVATSRGLIEEWPGVGGVEPTVQAPTSLHREYQPRPQRVLTRSVVRGRAANHNDNDCGEIDTGVTASCGGSAKMERYVASTATSRSPYKKPGLSTRLCQN